MIRRLTLAIALSIGLAPLLFAVTLNAQGSNIQTFLTQIANGWTSDARRALPDLLIDRPNDPEVMFLHATLVDDATKALPMYQRIVDAYPKSEWADDALFRIVAYYCIKRETEKARAAFLILRDSYSQSLLLGAAADLLRMTVGLPPIGEKKSEVAKAEKADTEKRLVPETPSAVRPYSIQVGSYSTPDKAQAMSEEFTKKRMKTRIAEKNINSAKRWVIQVGEYESEDAAKTDVSAVRDICKCRAFVVKR